MGISTLSHDRSEGRAVWKRNLTMEKASTFLLQRSTVCDLQVVFCKNVLQLHAQSKIHGIHATPQWIQDFHRFSRSMRSGIPPARFPSSCETVCPVIYPKNAGARIHQPINLYQQHIISCQNVMSHHIKRCNVVYIYILYITGTWNHAVPLHIPHHSIPSHSISSHSISSHI